MIIRSEQEKPGNPPGDSRSRDLADTRAILERHAQGDSKAAGDLFERFGPRLERFIGARIPARQRRLFDPPDLSQEVWARAFASLNGFEERGVGSFWAYLRQIGVRYIIDLSRRQGLDHGVSVEDSAERDPAVFARRPLSRLIEHEDLSAFEAALEKLSNREQDALRLRLELDLDYATIAQECGYPSADAARVAIRRMLNAVCKEMASSNGRSSA